jgi:hypothetical protein
MREAETEEDATPKTGDEIDRREFFGYLGAAGGLASQVIGRTQPLPAEDQDDGQAHYPGAHHFAGPWRLRVDREAVGKAHQWFRSEPSEKTPVSIMVPSCWQEYAPGFAGGVAWYFKEFTIPPDLRNRILRLKFWAVDYFAEVWLNGEAVGRHEGGFTPFEMDITSQAKVGAENHLVVRVVDPPRPLEQRLLGLPGWENTTDGVAGGFKFTEIPTGPQSWQEGFNFGGIWQPVELLATEPVYVSDVFIEPKLSEKAIEAQVEVTNRHPHGFAGKIRLVVHPWKDPGTVSGESEHAQNFPEGSQVARLRVGIDQAHPWSPDDPYLYVAKVSIEDGQGIRHETQIRFGLREFSVSDGFFQLNGKRIFIKGGHHQGTYPAKLEFPPTREFAYKEVRIFKEAGFNFCRLWVKPAPPAFLDAADELGLLLQEEPPMSIMADSPFLLERSVREVKEMVKRDRNHPSIVIWNMINEADQAMKYVREQCSAARALDPTRLITETAGGPTHYYTPYSASYVSYLDEHPYPGAPLAEDVYDYNQSRGIVGKLGFFSEYGFGGMNDIESVLASYGDQPKLHMEDYAGHLRLKQARDKAFNQSKLLQSVFGSMENLREVCQTAQADAVRLQTEAMRCNPGLGGYNYVQMFDSNAIEIDGLVDFWRNKRKKAFYAMQDANKPLMLVIRCSRMNVRSNDEFELRVTLINEMQISGAKKLKIRIHSPAAAEVFSKEITVEAKPWVSIVLREPVKLVGESGRYLIEAALSDVSGTVVHKTESCMVFAAEDLQWPAEPALVFDPDRQLEPYLQDRGIRYGNGDASVDRPAVIVVTPSSALWRRPDSFRAFTRLFPLVARGCTAVFLEVPTDGPCPLASAQFFMESFMSPCSIAHLTPFDRIESTDEVWAGQRIGAYSWGLSDQMAGMPIPKHPVFAGVPQEGLMGREFGNVVPVRRIATDWKPVEDLGSGVQIYSAESTTRIGKGKIIITSLNLLPNLKRDALAEKLLANLVRYAQHHLPKELEPEDPYTAESLQFQMDDYTDCLKKVSAAASS